MMMEFILGEIMKRHFFAALERERPEYNLTEILLTLYSCLWGKLSRKQVIFGFRVELYY